MQTIIVRAVMESCLASACLGIQVIEPGNSDLGQWAIHYESSCHAQQAFTPHPPWPEGGDGELCSSIAATITATTCFSLQLDAWLWHCETMWVAKNCMSKTKCFRPDSNWRSFACQANGLTNFPTKASGLNHSCVTGGCSMNNILQHGYNKSESGCWTWPFYLKMLVSTSP